MTIKKKDLSQKPIKIGGANQESNTVNSFSLAFDNLIEIKSDNQALVSNTELQYKEEFHKTKSRKLNK